MKIYNIYFNTNERKQHLGWSLANSDKKLLLSANVDGMTKTVISSTLKLKQSLPNLGNINDRDFKKNINVVPGFKTAKLGTVEEGNNNLNFALYVKAEEGKTISSMKLEGCSVVMSNIRPDRTQAAMIVVVHDKQFRLRVYQTDGRLLTVTMNGFKIDTVKHVIRPSKVLRPTVYVQLPEKMYLTSDVKSEKSKEMIEKGFTPVYIPLLLVKNKVLEIPQYENIERFISKEDMEYYTLEVMQKVFENTTLKDTVFGIV